MSSCVTHIRPPSDAHAHARNRDLYPIPTDLRVHLENCLGEDASPAVLEQHMPHIKRVIYRLLIGLKGKQEPYRLAIAEKKKASR